MRYSGHGVNVRKFLETGLENESLTCALFYISLIQSMMHKAEVKKLYKWCI